VFSAGPLFLGSYIFVYTLVIVAQNYFDRAVNWLVGGHEAMFWVRWEPVFALLQDALIEPIRLCLLAVAFRRCLELFTQRAAAQEGQAARPVATPVARRALDEAEAHS
jgi:hypothetical protein